MKRILIVKGTSLGDVVQAQHLAGLRPSRTRGRPTPPPRALRSRSARDRHPPDSQRPLTIAIQTFGIHIETLSLSGVGKLHVLIERGRVDAIQSSSSV
jgi:hypothetical protein